jgi:hypothetical protein
MAATEVVCLCKHRFPDKAECLCPHVRKVPNEKLEATRRGTAWVCPDCKCGKHVYPLGKFPRSKTFPFRD